jgi:hypothetical protein
MINNKIYSFLIFTKNINVDKKVIFIYLTHYYINNILITKYDFRINVN